MSRSTQDTARTATVRTISGHNVDIGSSFSKGVAAADPSTPISRQLAGSQPNTDRRRFLVTDTKRVGT